MASVEQNTHMKNKRLLLITQWVVGFSFFITLFMQPMTLAMLSFFCLFTVAYDKICYESKTM